MNTYTQAHTHNIYIYMYVSIYIYMLFTCVHQTLFAEAAGLSSSPASAGQPETGIFLRGPLFIVICTSTI